MDAIDSRLSDSRNWGSCVAGLYNAERNHQGIGNELSDAKEMPREGKIVRDKRLGGLLSFYRRAD